MTNSTVKTLSSRALQLASLFLLASPVAFGGEPVGSDRDVGFIGQMTVTATREVPLMGSLVVTAPRSSTVLVTDLGSMTVTAERESVQVADLGEMTVTAEREPAYVANLGEMTVTAETLVADLGTMTVTAERETVVAGNDESSRDELRARLLALDIPALITAPFVDARGKSTKAVAISRVRPW